MDQVTIVGLAASIVRLIDGGTALCRMAVEIRQSSSGMTQDNQRLADVVKAIRCLTEKLNGLNPGPLKDNERALRRAAKEYSDLSGQILLLNKKTRPTSPVSFWGVCWGVCRWVYKAWWCQFDIAGLQ